VKKITITAKTLVQSVGKKSSAKRLPRIETMFEDEGDPLAAVKYVEGDLEQSAANEETELLRLLKEKKKALLDQYRINYDTDYWVALCFQSSEQRNEFLEKVGWPALDRKYINGLEIARRLGLDVKPIILKPRGLRGHPKRYKREEVI